MVVASKVPDNNTGKEELDSIGRVKNSHTRRMTQLLIEKRREHLHTLLSKGYSLTQAATVLGCSQETLSNDRAALRKYFSEQMKMYIQHQLPELWHSCMENIQQIIKMSWDIAESHETTTNNRIHALSLLATCTEIKRDLISDPTIINDAIRLVDETRHTLIALRPEDKGLILQEQREKEEEEELQEQEEIVENEEGEEGYDERIVRQQRQQRQQQDRQTNNGHHDIVEEEKTNKSPPAAMLQDTLDDGENKTDPSSHFYTAASANSNDEDDDEGGDATNDDDNDDGGNYNSVF